MPAEPGRNVGHHEYHPCWEIFSETDLPLVQSNSQRPLSHFTCMVRWSYDVPCKTRSSFEPDIVKKTSHTGLGHVPGALSVPYKFGGLNVKSILDIYPCHMYFRMIQWQSMPSLLVAIDCHTIVVCSLIGTPVCVCDLVGGSHLLQLPLARPSLLRCCCSVGQNLNHSWLQGGAPQVISWFIIPLTIDISTISPSY